jgi:plasmid replication initiation protein
MENNNKHNDLVKYDNEFNKLQVNLTPRERDLMMLISQKLYNQKDKTITMTFAEISSKLGYRFESMQILANTLGAFYKKVNKSIIIQSPHRFLAFQMFNWFDVSDERQTLEIEMNKKFTYMLNELGFFTQFSLAQFISVRGKYAKVIYQLCRQWSRTQNYTQIYEVNDFLKRLNVPSSFTWSRGILNKCINPAFKELAPIFGSMQLHKHKTGRKIDKVFISFTRTEQAPRRVLKTSYEQLSEVTDKINEYKEKAKKAKNRDSDTYWKYIELLNIEKSKRGKLQNDIRLHKQGLTLF